MAQAFSPKRGSLPPLPFLPLFTVQGVLHPLAGRWCLGPSSPAPAPRSTCAGVCDTALTSVGASSQSGAGTRASANRGRGLRLRRLEANEGQCLALCNPPPGPAELPLGCWLQRRRTGGRRALARPGTGCDQTSQSSEAWVSHLTPLARPPGPLVHPLWPLHLPCSPALPMAQT